MVTFGQCYIFALEFFGSRGINLSEAQMSEFCYALLAFTEAAQHRVQPTVESGRELPAKKSNRKGSAPAVSG